MAPDLFLELAAVHGSARQMRTVLDKIALGTVQVTIMAAEYIVRRHKPAILVRILRERETFRYLIDNIWLEHAVTTVFMVAADNNGMVNGERCSTVVSKIEASILRAHETFKYISYSDIAIELINRDNAVALKYAMHHYHGPVSPLLLHTGYAGSVDCLSSEEHVGSRSFAGPPNDLVASPDRTVDDNVGVRH